MFAEKILIWLGIIEPSDYENYYENVDWRTFRTDERVFERNKRISIRYVREMQTCYEQLLEELGNNYLYDVESILQQFQESHKEVCRLQTELAICKGELESTKRQLTDALSWQTATGRRNEVLSCNGFEPEEVQEVARTTNKRFAPADGVSKKAKMKQAIGMSENGISVTDIAKVMSISTSTIKSYISTVRGHCTIIDRQGERFLAFDEQYGNDVVNLGLFALDNYPELAAV